MTVSVPSFSRTISTPCVFRRKISLIPKEAIHSPVNVRIERSSRELRLWRHYAKRWLSHLRALAGIPLLISESEYESALPGYTIEVIDCGHRGGIYPMIEIIGNGQTMDLYCFRLTGKFDGTWYLGGVCVLPLSKPLNLPEKKWKKPRSCCTSG